MKTENYQKKDGAAGVKYTLEKGDVIKPLYSKPRESTLGKSKSISFSIKAFWEDKEIFVTLTYGQYKRLMGIANLKGRKLVAIGYPGPSGKELVGLDMLE